MNSTSKRYLLLTALSLCVSCVAYAQEIPPTGAAENVGCEFSRTAARGSSSYIAQQIFPIQDRWNYFSLRRDFRNIPVHVEIQAEPLGERQARMNIYIVNSSTNEVIAEGTPVNYRHENYFFTTSARTDASAHFASSDELLSVQCQIIYGGSRRMHVESAPMRRRR